MGLVRNTVRSLVNNFSRKMHSEKGTWAGVAMGVGTLGSAAITTFGNRGGSEQQAGYIDPGVLNDYYKAQRDLAQMNVAQGQTALDWTKYYQPQMKAIAGQLTPAITGQLQQGGLPADLDQAIWNMAKQRTGTSYDQLGDQIGIAAASRGNLNSGAVMQNWMNQVGLGKAQAFNDLATQRATANYDQYNKAISQAQTMLGFNPTSYAPTSMISPTSTQDNATNWNDIGSLFSKGIRSINFGGGKSSTTGAGNTSIWGAGY